MTNWTKFSERLPEKDQRQVFVLWDEGGVSVDRVCDLTAHLIKAGHVVAWHPITYPEVPREETQEEKDEQAALELFDVSMTLTPKDKEAFLRGFRLALINERAEVAKELAAIITSNGSDIAHPWHRHDEALNRLRKRVGLDK